MGRSTEFCVGSVAASVVSAWVVILRADIHRLTRDAVTTPKVADMGVGDLPYTPPMEVSKFRQERIARATPVNSSFAQ
nr:hypothetical protein CFP56_16782 [Quercus suber]